MEAQAENKNRYIALAFTIGFHALLFLLFILVVFITPIPPFEIKPVPEIEIGLGMEGMGQDPGGSGNNSKDLATAMDAAPVTKTQASDAPDVITDPTETEVPMKTNPDSKKDVKEDVKTPAEQQASSELLNALAKLKNKNGGKGEGNGNTGGSGDGKGAGVGDGDDDGKGNRPGIGQGKGGFELSGRSLVNRPDRLTDATEEGVVVVEIIVSAEGKVIKATAGQKGSTTFSSKLYSKARQAALSATFSPRTDGSTDTQRGTYTFVFTLE
ncbi:MAG: tolA full: protein TolA [Bacteroidetes bacterium]|nr:tolA full: protein TolA [Bacteroidota bacterium]